MINPSLRQCLQSLAADGTISDLQRDEFLNKNVDAVIFAIYPWVEIDPSMGGPGQPPAADGSKPSYRLRDYSVFPPDLENSGSILGWGVYRNEPWDFAGLYQSEEKAKENRAGFAEEYNVAIGSHKPWTRLFRPAL